MEIIGQLIGNWAELLGYSVAILGGLVGVALIIPGEQPDKALQGALNFLLKFSVKK